MEESNNDPRVTQELYFLIAKFLSGGPLKETAKTLLRELENVEVLPRRLDWEGNENTQSYDELLFQYRDVPTTRLLDVCRQTLRLAQAAPRLEIPNALTNYNEAQIAACQSRLETKFSLLGDYIVKPKVVNTPYTTGHSLVRRLYTRESGWGRAAFPGGRKGETLFSPRILSSLQLQRRTLGHLSAVYCLVFDRSGQYVITGADDLLVKVWSAIDGRLLATLRGAGAEITDVCVSHDGSLLACGSVDRCVRVWSLDNGAPAAVLMLHQGTITAVHWSRLITFEDTRWLASTSTDGSVVFWSGPADQLGVRPVQFVERSRPGQCHMICAAWSAGGGFLAAGSADHHVRVYAIKDQLTVQRILEIAAHSEAVDSISWAHRGLRFVSGSKDGLAAVWTLNASVWRHTALRHGTDFDKVKVTMVCWDISDRFVITAVSDCTLRVWCSRTCQQIRTLSGHVDEVYVLEAHPFLPCVFLSAGHDGQLRIWDASTGETITSFLNEIEGQGAGAMFDAKWGSGCTVAASDSHGHLLLFGLGKGHPLFAELPTELFFHTDYRPLVRDFLGGALDEQSSTPPHLMPPPYLVDVEGAPHPARLQRLVPRRVEPRAPATSQPDRLDLLIEELANREDANANNAPVEGPRGPWRGEGVRQTSRFDSRPGSPSEHPPLQLLPEMSPAAKAYVKKLGEELHELEQLWYSREMRRRPVMINTDKQANKRQVPRPRARVRARQNVTVERVEEEPIPEPETSSESSDGGWHSDRDGSSLSENSLSSNSSSSSSGSSYSEWENGATLAPPRRARRKQQPSKRYSPSITTPSKRPERNAAVPSTSTTTPPPVVTELPEAYRVGEWLTTVSPRKSPYHPQMGDECLYFRLGHQRYFEAVSEKDVYKVNPRDKPWERTHVEECELVKVIGIRYTIVPPRVVSLKLSTARATHLTVKYHDMPDVIDFMVLVRHYTTACNRNWQPGDRFRCMIDDYWWCGQVLEVDRPGSAGIPGRVGWWRDAHHHFLSVKVRWDNGEMERLSPWDLEPIDPNREASTPGGAVPVLPSELEHMYSSDCETSIDAERTIALHMDQVMSLSAAEPFVAPVDLQLYPAYAMTVPYPVDLATIRARAHNLFYRRMAAVQFDARYLASNAEMFNQPRSPIVRQARLITDLLLYIINNWQDVNVVQKYHELAAEYRSSDDELTLAEIKPRANKHRTRTRRSRHSPETDSWKEKCSRLLRELCSSNDAEPFREPVSLEHAPDYHQVISEPMDLSTVRVNLESDRYSKPEQFAQDMRRIFTNSRLYNTNKRSRIYSMTVRLSSLFEEMWTRAGLSTRRKNRTNYAALNGNAPRRRDRSRDSDSEPLARHARRRQSRKRRKGKGVGKKSKMNASASTQDEATHVNNTTPFYDQPEAGPSYIYTNGGSPSPRLKVDSSSDDEQPLLMVEQLDDWQDLESDLEKEEPVPRRIRKRIHSSSDDDADSWRDTRKRPDRDPPPMRRERITDGSSSSSSSHDDADDGAVTMHYGSDGSYHPRDSTDDDQPLLLIRQRQEAGTSAPSTKRSRRETAVPRRYNEESEDEAATAISKRRHAHRDHDYTQPTTSAGTGEASNSSSHPLSISSRGRVRRLTAKARGLLPH